MLTLSLLGARRGARAMALAASVLGLAACSRPEPMPEPVRSVKLLVVGAATYSAQREFAGEVRARSESRLGFRVPGKLLAREVEVGQRVQAGQVLARLDAQDYRLAAEAARAQVAAATTQRDLAAADLQRYRTLQAQGFISGAELQRREATLQAAQASLDQARAQAQGQTLQTDYTRLLADMAGVVTGVDAEPGQVLAAGAPVVRVAQDGARDAVFSVPEDQIGRIQVGQRVIVRTWAERVQLPGRVREVAASADPATRTYLVKAAIEPPPGQPLPALGATVHALPEGLQETGRPVITLPTTAVHQAEGSAAVWVFEPGSSSVRRQPVQVGGADGNALVIVAGLVPGMQVVATGGHVLAPGQKVTVYRDQVQSSPAPTGQPSQVAPALAPASR